MQRNLERDTDCRLGALVTDDIVGMVSINMSNSFESTYQVAAFADSGQTQADTKNLYGNIPNV